MGWDFKEIPGGIICSERPFHPPAPRGRSPAKGDFQMGASESGERPSHPPAPRGRSPAKGDFQMGAPPGRERPLPSQRAFLQIMEKLPVTAILFFHGLADENTYSSQLNECFLSDPSNDDYLYLEWENDIGKAVAYLRTHINPASFDRQKFGKFFLRKLQESYEHSPDIKVFAARMYGLWKSLPENLQNIEPFFALCYVDEPLEYGDEKQTRSIFEQIFRHQ